VRPEALRKPLAAGRQRAAGRDDSEPKETMEVGEIKALLALMDEHGLSELEIEDKRGKVRLVRGLPHHNSGPWPAAHPEARSFPVNRAPAATATDARAALSSQRFELAPNQKLVQSPMVGTFYRAPSPDSAPFVEEGSAVKEGQPLCIIEAMKMMNEIEAETAGRVLRFLCDNGQPVEYGQPLLVLEVA